MGKKRRKPITTYRNRTQKESSGNHAGISIHVGSMDGFVVDATRDNAAKHDFSVEVGKRDFSDSKSSTVFSTETERTQGRQELGKKQAESITPVDRAVKSAEKRSRERNARNMQINSDYSDEEIRAQRDDVSQDTPTTEKDFGDNSQIVKEVYSEAVRSSDYRWNGEYHKEIVGHSVTEKERKAPQLSGKKKQRNRNRDIFTRVKTKEVTVDNQSFEGNERSVNDDHGEGNGEGKNVFSRVDPILEAEHEQESFWENSLDQKRPSSYKKRMAQQEMRRRRRKKTSKNRAEFRDSDHNAASDYNVGGNDFDGFREYEEEPEALGKSGGNRQGKRQNQSRNSQRLNREKKGNHETNTYSGFHVDSNAGIDFRNRKDTVTGKDGRADNVVKSAIQSPFRFAEAQTKGAVHDEIAEGEEENVAVEAAHKGELAMEQASGWLREYRYRKRYESRYGYRQKKQSQRGSVGRNRKQSGQAKRDKELRGQIRREQGQKGYQHISSSGNSVYGFKAEKSGGENAASRGFRRGNDFSQDVHRISVSQRKKLRQKTIQKNRIKREYLLARRKRTAARNTAQNIRRTRNVTEFAARKAQEIVARNASLIIPILKIGILLILVMAIVSCCGAMFGGTTSMVMAGTYLSDPREIDSAELLFTELETNLQDTIDSIETDYPGYDRYDYNIGEIGHNPFTLISYLSAKYTEFTLADVEEEIRELFSECYDLSITPVTEDHVRVFPDPYGRGNDYIQHYEVDVLQITLTVTPLETVVAARMNEEQTEQYELYTDTAGGLQLFDSPLELDWYRYISNFYGYRKNPETGENEIHRGLDLAVPSGTEVFAGNSGTVATGYDEHYGYYISIMDENGHVTKYAHLESVDVTDGHQITHGERIGKTGNSGSTVGSKLHIECMYDGEYYNPIFYFDTGEGSLYGESDQDRAGSGTGVNVGDGVPPASYDDATVQLLFEEGNKYLGMPYTFGGTPPESFDCSAFICWIFTNSHVKTIPRTTAQALYEMSEPVAVSEAKAGDLIFFTGTYDAGRPVTHVGLYCGNGVMLHCGDPIKYSSINTPYWQSHFYSFGRVSLDD